MRARLARSYEELRGRDIEGFVRFVDEQEAVGAMQLEAVSEEEGADAVRLLTIHAAKGLEFKVVVVADAGRDTGGPPSADEILALSDGRFGFRVVHPATGKPHGVFGYEEVREAGLEADRTERLRLYYVAMTRAVDRLIVSGSIDVEERRETPIGWALSRLECADELEAAEGPIELERGGATFLVRVDRRGAPVEAAAPAADEEPGQLALFDELPTAPAPRGYVLPELVPVPSPPIHRVRRLSYSALALFERCSYRYYAERVAGLRERRGVMPGAVGLAATEIGDAVHRLLELVDLSDPRAPDVGVVRSWYPAVADEELARIGAFVEAYCESDLARRVASLAGCEARAAVRLRARRRAAARPPRRPVSRGAARARPRLQDEPARRADARGDRRGRVPRAASRLCARVLPRRGRGGRGRLRVPRARRCGRLDGVLA